MLAGSLINSTCQLAKTNVYLLRDRMDIQRKKYTLWLAHIEVDNLERINPIVKKLW